MPALCSQIERFSDGELGPDEAEAFRDHLASCVACQTELNNLLILARLGARYVEMRPPGKPPVPPLRPDVPLPQRQAAGYAAAMESPSALEEPRGVPLSQRQASHRAHRAAPRWVSAGLRAAACALIIGGGAWMAWRNGQSDIPELAWNPGGRTLTTPRLSDPRADRYRPVAQQMMGSEAGAELPLQALAKLGEDKDFRGLAAAYLAWNKPEDALATLAKLDPADVNVQSDRAAVLLSLNRSSEALPLLDQVLATRSDHAQARWNRALAYEALGMPLSAARDYQVLSKPRSADDGWAREAAERAAKLTQTERELEGRWKTTKELGEALARDGRLPEGASVSNAPILRLYFYEAVRTRVSRDEVLALKPLARQLDLEAGGDVLQRYVERIAARDFGRRAPFARQYAELRAGALPATAVQSLIEQLLRSGEDDIALGALVNARAVAANFAAFEKRAAASGDPWFRIYAAQQLADLQQKRGDFVSARATLERVRGLCGESRQPAYRCMDLALDLAHLHAQFIEPDDAWRHALAGWELARGTNTRSKERQLLEELSNAARLHNALSVARAFLGEALERSRGEPDHESWIHVKLAHLSLYALDFDQARAEIDRALAASNTLTLDGAEVVADIARLRRAPGDAAVMEAHAMRAAGSPSKGERAYALHLLGRFYVDQDRAKGRGLLRDSIREAESADTHDEYAQHARTYSYTSLILDAAKEGDYDGALRLFGQELGFDAPDRCVLALTEDSERLLLVARGADGGTIGHYEGARTRRLPEELTGVVPARMLATLEGCGQVKVLARAPLQGRSGLLPQGFAWSYWTRGEQPKPVEGRPVHLVVTDVVYDAGRKLKPLSWTPSFGPTEQRRVLRGPDATPSRVLGEMVEATEIDLATHGLISPVSDASYLVLAKEPGPNGTDELRSRFIREAKLKGAPLVLLAACNAGRAAPVLHEPVSLSNAFLEAGARAVISATKPIPDQESSTFFAGLRERLRAGASPAAALRDERQVWMQQGRGTGWIESVLLFE